MNTTNVRPPLHERYDIVNILGAGRHGTTYLATAKKAPHAAVAVKILKAAGMAGAAVDVEAYIARMSAIADPAVVQVRDAGVDTSGCVYVVTDFIVGSQIVDYCDRSRLSTVERFRLFAQVTAAVDAAHRQGIVHGHLVSDNVLVTDAVGHPVATVMDFAHGMLIGRRQSRPSEDVRGLSRMLARLLLADGAAR